MDIHKRNQGTTGMTVNNFSVSEQPPAVATSFPAGFSQTSYPPPPFKVPQGGAAHPPYQTQPFPTQQNIHPGAPSTAPWGPPSGPYGSSFGAPGGQYGPGPSHQPQRSFGPHAGAAGPPPGPPHGHQGPPPRGPPGPNDPANFQTSYGPPQGLHRPPPPRGPGDPMGFQMNYGAPQGPPRGPPDPDHPAGVSASYGAPPGFHGPPPRGPPGPNQGPPMGQFNFSQPPPMPTPAQMSSMTPPPSQFSTPPPFMNPGSFNYSMHSAGNQKGQSYPSSRVDFTDTSKQSTNLSPRDLGQKKLEAWLQKTKRAKKTQKNEQEANDKSLKLWEFTQHLSQMSELLNTMTSQTDELERIAASSDTSSWDAAVHKLNNSKQQFCELQRNMTEANICGLEKRLNERRKKRERLKKARKEKYEQSQMQQEEWKEKSKSIDAWQEMCTHQLKEENKKRARKAAADKTLSKVNKEIHDANRLIETMMALQKLRLVRRDAAQKRGDADLGESRESFEQKITDMIRLVKGQLEFYKEEEERLQKIIKSEVEESNKREKEILEEKDRLKQAEEDTELEKMLFGGDAKVDEADPVFPFTQFYREAEYNLQAFLNIRHQWDAFLTSENTPGASCIPSSWIVPDEPNSAFWASALK